MAITSLGEDREIGIGIVGTGTISRSHANNLARCSNVKLLACCDIVKDAVGKFGAQFDVEHTFTDHRDMLALEGLDAVVVATPPFAHLDPVIDALQSGKHVLCEKPFAMNAKEAEAMASAAKSANLGLAVCCSRNRFRPVTQLAYRVATGGDLGEIYRARKVFLRRRGRPGYDILQDSAWFLTHERSGGGVIADLGHYHIDEALWYLDWPKVLSVSANVTRNQVEPVIPSEVKNDVEEHVDAAIRLEGGKTFSLEISWITHMEGANGTWLYGTKGGLRVTDSVTLFQDRFGVPVDTRLPLPRRFPESDVDRDFIEAIREGRHPVTTADQGVVISKIVDAIYESSVSQREIRLA